LFDEPETHLHPRWQRKILPSLAAAVNALRQSDRQPPQVVVATHSPLVLASLEPLFGDESDDLIQLDLLDGQVQITQGKWAAQGDVTNWLVSETFGLEKPDRWTPRRR
jgi:predicted ATP-binding protein involved in virulence